MKTIEVEIRGTSPLLIHRFSEEAEHGGNARATLVEKKDPREEARKVAYVAPDGTFYFNGFSIPRAMANAGANHKMKGSRKSLRYVVPSAVRVASEITIQNGNGPAENFEVDARPVTIPATKGRVMRYRPRFNEWGAKFTLLVDETVLPVDLAHRLLVEAGVSFGIGDFRPEKGGPFGCFRVVEFQE